jgi:hypothetical protein
VARLVISSGMSAAPKPRAPPPSAGFMARARSRTDSVDAAPPLRTVTRRAIELTVSLKSGHGLLAADKNGKSDPYVVLTIGRQKRKSATVRANLDPVWDEAFVFKSDDEDLLERQLRLHVYDEDFRRVKINSMNDDLGKLSVSLVALKTAQTIEFVEELSTQGTVQFSVSKREVEVTVPKPTVLGAVAKKGYAAAAEARHLVGSAGSGTLRAARDPASFVQKKADAATSLLLEKMLDQVGGIVKEALKDPDMPERVKEMVDRAHDAYWQGLASQVRRAT